MTPFLDPKLWASILKWRPEEIEAVVEICGEDVEDPEDE